MSDWPEVQTCYVLPSGVATLPFEGGAITCRVTLGHINAPDTGLLEEMQSKADPVPWRNAEIRDEAMRVSDLLCMSNLSHASILKEHDNNDDFQGRSRRTA